MKILNFQGPLKFPSVYRATSKHSRGIKVNLPFAEMRFGFQSKGFSGRIPLEFNGVF